MNSIFKVTPVPIGRIPNTILLFVVLIFGLADLKAQTPQACASGQNIVASGFQCTIGGLTFSPFPQNASVEPLFITSAFVQPSGAVELDLSRGNQLACCGNFFLEVVGRVTSVTVTNLVVNSPIFAEICSPVPCGFGQPTQSLGFIDPPDHKSGSLSFPAVSSLSVDGGDGPPSLDPFSLVFNAPTCQAPPTPPPLTGSNWYQLDPDWANDQYDHVEGLNNTIGFQGCALIALNYALNAAGANFNPSSLNTQMGINVGDFSLPISGVPGSGGRVIFSSAVADVSGGSLKFDKTQSGQTTTQALDSNLCSSTPHPVLVQVTNPTTGHQHYVVVTGKSGNTYSIVDPGYLVNPRTTLSIYGDQFTVVGVVKKPTGNDPSELDFSIVDNATLLVTGPDATQTGLDPTSRQPVKGSPDAAFFAIDNASDSDDHNDPPTSTTYSVQWFLPPTGDYNIQLNGTKLGTFDLVMKAFDANGKAAAVSTLSGITGPGATTSIQIKFDSFSGSISPPVRISTLSGALDDIDNSFQLGLIDNSGIRNSLAKKVQHAGFATGQDRINSLTAFINEVQAQAGKHIMGVAVQVLLEDAQSILTQTVH